MRRRRRDPPMLSCFVLAVAACSDAGTPPVANQTANAAEVVIAETETPPAEGEAPAAQPAAPEPAQIPARFRGLWAENRQACGRLSDPSRLTITDRTVRYPAFVLLAEAVDLPTEQSFAVKGHNKQTEAPAEAHFSIDVTGLILTDEAGGGAVRVRCG